MTGRVWSRPCWARCGGRGTRLRWDGSDCTRVTAIEQLPPAKVVLLDLSPRPILKIAAHRFPPAYQRQLERYRYGMGVFKVDWALDAPIPWTAEPCRRAGTVHVGGTFED